MKSQELTGLDMPYFLKGGFWLFFGNVAVAIIGLILLLVFTNFVDPRLFGEWRFYLSVVGTASIFALPGLFTAIQQSVSVGYDSSLLKGMKIKLKWSIISSIVLIIASIYLFFNYPGNAWIYYLITALFFPLFISGSCIFFYIVGKKEFRLFTKYKIVTNIFTSLSILIPLILTKNLIITITSYIIVTILIHFYYFIRIINERKECFSKKIDKGLGKYGLNLTLMNSLQSLNQHIDKIILTNYIGFASFATYALVISVIEQIQSQSKIINMLTLPKFSVLDPIESYKKIKKIIIYFLIISGVTCLIFYFSMPILVPIIFSEKYIGAIRYIQLSSLTLITIPLINMFTTYLEALKKVKSLYYYRLVVGIVQTTLFCVLIPMFKIGGAISTIIIAQFFSLFFLIFLVESSFRKNKKNKLRT